MRHARAYIGPCTPTCSIGSPVGSTMVGSVRRIWHDPKTIFRCRLALRSHSHLHRTTKIECLMPASSSACAQACVLQSGSTCYAAIVCNHMYRAVAPPQPGMPICLLTWQLSEALLGRCHGRVARAEEMVGAMVGCFHTTSCWAPAGGGCCISVAECPFIAIPFPHSIRLERGT